MFQQLTSMTRVRLQSELFSLTVPGGPRYTPSRVRSKASRTLDRLFPSGSVVRRLTRLGFRVIHPGDWWTRAWSAWQGFLVWWVSVWRRLALRVIWGIRQPGHPPER